MSAPHFTILYVRSPVESARFYAKLLQTEPREASDGFAMFAWPSGAGLGLWAAPDVAPAATPPGGSELAWAVPGDAALDALHARWQELGVTVLQAPTRMDFGYTFTAVDPDGHRLRAFAPGAE